MPQYPLVLSVCCKLTATTSNSSQLQMPNLQGVCLCQKYVPFADAHPCYLVPQADLSDIEGRVKDYMHCLAGDRLLDCQMAEETITRVGMASNYVGVLHTLTSNSQAGVLLLFPPPTIATFLYAASSWCRERTQHCVCSSASYFKTS